MMHMLQWLYMSLSSVCSKCFILFSTFIASDSSRCCKYFKRTSQLFYLDVAYVCNGFQEFSCAFASVLDACGKYFSRFVWILQMFHLDVSKVDRDVAHVAKWLTYHNRLLHQLGRRACAWGSGGMERCSAVGAGSGGLWRQGHRQYLRGMRVRQAEGCGRISFLGATNTGIKHTNGLQPRASLRGRLSGRPGACSADIWIANSGRINSILLICFLNLEHQLAYIFISLLLWVI
jgi:hypothetical protein